ncbi:MAG TPA: glutamate-cysteine ligase family protein, partial [Pirellulales bacterium]|nr:glutamate-cysteine ligase family protein [Pirellulales bacterium]
MSERDATTETELGLFQALGVELEYMIVDADTLSVRPIADELLREPSGEIVSEVEHGPIAWSNELVAHVIELKTNGPAATLDGLNEAFAGQVREIGGLLAAHGARLMPTAMHPWMDPHRETRLWPHDYSVVYQTFDRIFGCQGHGWSNL